MFIHHYTSKHLQRTAAFSYDLERGKQQIAEDAIDDPDPQLAQEQRRDVRQGGTLHQQPCRADPARQRQS